MSNKCRDITYFFLNQSEEYIYLHLAIMLSTNPMEKRKNMKLCKWSTWKKEKISIFWIGKAWVLSISLHDPILKSFVITLNIQIIIQFLMLKFRLNISAKLLPSPQKYCQTPTLTLLSWCRKAHPCLCLLQAGLLQCTTDWNPQQEHPKAPVCAKQCC